MDDFAERRFLAEFGPAEFTERVWEPGNGVAQRIADLEADRERLIRAAARSLTPAPTPPPRDHRCSSASPGKPSGVRTPNQPSSSSPRAGQSPPAEIDTALDSVLQAQAAQGWTVVARTPGQVVMALSTTGGSGAGWVVGGALGSMAAHSTQQQRLHIWADPNGAIWARPMGSGHMHR
ncbi:hypothetical protein [Kitasatospora sp. CB01950]|uniref:hypothetical protein n=1 Tax=Kitasatospora sp. CB01950 TaxID=1703930 RepID=UPI00116136A1|nr:hypothetical protein [Kitasatospora sp. CB01950]